MLPTLLSMTGTPLPLSCARSTGRRLQAGQATSSGSQSLPKLDQCRLQKKWLARWHPVLCLSRRRRLVPERRRYPLGTDRPPREDLLLAPKGQTWRGTAQSGPTTRRQVETQGRGQGDQAQPLAWHPRSPGALPTRSRSARPLFRHIPRETHTGAPTASPWRASGPPSEERWPPPWQGDAGPRKSGTATRAATAQAHSASRAQPWIGPPR